MKILKRKKTGLLNRFGNLFSLHSMPAFEKLSVLPKIIQALVSDWQAEIEGAVKSAVDIEDINKKAKGKVISALTSTTPGKASLPSNGGQVAAFRNLLWTRLDQMVNLIERRLTQSRLLCVTLQKKRPSTGIPSSSATLASRLCSFLMEKADDPQEKDCCSAIIFVLSTEELNSDGDSVKTKLADLKVRHAHYFSESYYNGLLGWVATCMSAVFEPALRRRSGQLKDVLESDYPRMLKLFLNLSGHQRHLSRPIERFLAPFETAYLARCLTRLFDRVNSTFIGVTPVESVGGNLPRITDIEQVVQSAATELAHSAAVHPELFCKVARNVAKMVALFATKVEALIVTSPEASQVSIDGLLNPAQQTNSHLVNFTCAFVDRLRMAVARHTTNQQQKRGHAKAGADDAQAIVDHAISSKLSGVCLAALEPLLTGIADHVIDQILPRMHKEALDNLEDPAYVQDLQIFVNRIRSVYLAGFSTSTSTTSCCLRSANVQLFTSGEAAVRFGLQSRVLPRCLDALAVHSSLFRPCTGDVERSRLTTSNAAIEVALAALAPPSTFTDDPFIRLRALRQLFSTPTDEILSVTKTIEFQSDARGAVGFVGSSLPGSLALHHVIARSPNEIPLPHETASGWTLERYVRWCQAVADEPTRLAFISKSLDVYAEQVEARKQRVYPQLYIVVRDMLESCAAETSTA
uniref:Conserved oligomeric Golgi complex subunit 5 n=1 Tax=Mesocestoides corti TaxID=53468 RepID=A0A5K3EZS7_MESCO